MNNNNFIVPIKGRHKSNFVSPSFLIMADRAGDKMKTYGPISLLSLGRHSLIDIQIAAIRSVFKNSEIIICCGFEAERVIKYIKQNYKNENIRIVENQKYDTTGCAESVRLCLNNINNDSCFILNGGLVLYPELINVRGVRSYTLSINHVDLVSTLNLGCVTDEKDELTNITYNVGKFWSEILFLSNAEYIESIRKIISQDSYRCKFFFEAINDLTSRQKFKISNINADLKLVKISNVKSYQGVKFKYENIGTQLFFRDQY